MPALSERGWHTTPVYGVFGAAAAACFIYYGASLMETVNALAIAASRAGGVRGNFGTQTKALHAGLSAADGIECAQMAMCGITGSSGVIEKADGFAKCFVGSSLPKNDEVTNEWDLEKNGLVFKRYPCCSGSHPANDVWDEYVRKTNLQVEDIEKNRVWTEPSRPPGIELSFSGKCRCRQVLIGIRAGVPRGFRPSLYRFFYG